MNLDPRWPSAIDLNAQRSRGMRASSDHLAPPHRDALDEPLQAGIARVLDGVLADADDMVVRYDLQLRRVWANRRFDEITGLQPALYVGRTLEEVCSLSPPSRLAVLACLHRVLASGTPNHCDFQETDSGGEPRWMALRASMERSKDGTPTGILTIARDIGEHKSAQDRLRERAREFRTLVEQSPDFIVRYNTSGERTYVNPAVRQVIGSTDLPEGQAPRSGSVIVELDVYQRLIDQVLATGEPRSAELRARLGDGSVIWLDMRICAESDDHGQVVSAFAIGRDISTAVTLREAIRDRPAQTRSPPCPTARPCTTAPLS